MELSCFCSSVYGLCTYACGHVASVVPFHRHSCLLKLKYSLKIKAYAYSTYFYLSYVLLVYIGFARKYKGFYGTNLIKLFEFIMQVILILLFPTTNSSYFLTRKCISKWFAPWIHLSYIAEYLNIRSCPRSGRTLKIQDFPGLGFSSVRKLPCTRFVIG